MFVVPKMKTAKAAGTTVLQVVTVAGTEHNVTNAPQLTKIRLTEDVAQRWSRKSNDPLTTRANPEFARSVGA